MRRKNYLYKDYVDFLFGLLKPNKSGQGGMLFRNLQSAYDSQKISSFRHKILNAIVFNLQENGYLKINDDKVKVTTFVSVTDSGYDYYLGGDVVSNTINLNFYVDLKEDFENLWLFVASEEAPFKLKEEEMFDAIASNLSIGYKGLNDYKDRLASEGKSTSYRFWLKEKWDALNDEEKSSVLNSISQKISIVYEQYISHNVKDNNTDRMSNNNTYNINAAIVNTGSGVVNTGDVKIENSHIGSHIEQNEARKQFIEILEQIKKIAEDLNNQDVNDAIELVEEQVSSNSWVRKSLNLGLNAILGVTTGIVANGLSPLVKSAVALLPLI